MDNLAPLHLAAAFLLANLPWLAPGWTLCARCVGWTFAYLLWAIVPVLLQRAAGDGVPPPWELWPVTLALFAVAAFPGLVWRHLLR